MKDPETLKTRSVGDKREVFDPIRKKWVALTPEERVRQSFIYFLVHKKGVPPELIAVEHEFKGVLNKIYRADIIVFDRNGNPEMLIECKAEDVPITRNTVLQATRYNSLIKARYVTVTNGLQNYLFKTENTRNYATSIRSQNMKSGDYDNRS